VILSVTANFLHILDGTPSTVPGLILQRRRGIEGRDRAWSVIER
jgi:hypothetical protein